MKKKRPRRREREQDRRVRVFTPEYIQCSIQEVEIKKNHIIGKLNESRKIIEKCRIQRGRRIWKPSTWRLTPRGLGQLSIRCVEVKNLFPRSPFALLSLLYVYIYTHSLQFVILTLSGVTTYKRIRKRIYSQCR